MAASTWDVVDWAAHRHEVRVHSARLRYVDYGEGPPLLLVHGMAGSWESWLANIHELGEHHRVIAVDLPGFGGSDPLSAGSDFDGYVDMLQGLLDELGLRAVGVVGHSLGGLVALSLAALSPERVRCLVLVSGGGATLSTLRLVIIQVVFWLFRLVLMVPGVAAFVAGSSIGRLLLSPAVHDWRVLPRELLALMIPRSVGPGFMDAVRLGSAHLGRLEVAKVAAPALLIWGREDRILPLADARRLASELARAQLVVLDDVGHCAMFERPGEFNELVLGFLDMQRLDRGVDSSGRPTATAWLTAGGRDDLNERCRDGAAG